MHCKVYLLKENVFVKDFIFLLSSFLSLKKSATKTIIRLSLMVLENIFTLFHAYSIYSIYLIKGIEYTQKRLLHAHLLEQH